MDDLYRDYILEHYRRPHNFGVLEEPSATFEGANPLCGDRITMQLTVKDGVVDRGRLHRPRLRDQPGVGVAAHGRGQGQARRGRRRRSGPTDLLELLGIEISPARLKCAMLSFESLQHLLDEIGVKPLTKDAG